MRKTIVAAVVALFCFAGTLGCKSAPKMAWWKTAEKSDVESTALAHSAPALPADIAKQAESFATTSPSIQMSGGEAAPYSSAPAFSPAATSVAAAPPASVGLATTGSGAKSAPTAAPTAGYPTTGASPYASTAAPVVAATTPPAYASNDKSANLGSVQMPYNPNAVPPAKTVAAAPSVTPSTTPDRYGMASTASSPAFGGANTAPVATASLPQLGGGRYGNLQNAASQQTTPTLPPASVDLASTKSPTTPSTSTAPAYAATPTIASARTSAPANVPAMTTPPANLAGSRYAMSNTPTPSAASVAPVVSETQPSAVVASASPYRPGGTASYEGAATESSAIEVATRPNSVGQQVPNVATPGSTPEPSPAPRYR